MIINRTLAGILALPLATVSAPAAACSVTNEYRVPTNLELVQEADLILLGKVVEGNSGEDLEDHAITVSPLVALKGDAPAQSIALAGMSLTEGELGAYGILSNPFEFDGAHPTSYIGACIRRMFPRGTTALFFLAREDGRWRPATGPFSRWAEDVPGEDAPWVELVRLYVRAAALPDDQRRTLLIEERDGLSARREDPVAQLMAADIARQLAGPKRPWNDLLLDQIEIFSAAGEAAAAVGSIGQAVEETHAGRRDVAGEVTDQPEEMD